MRFKRFWVSLFWIATFILCAFSAKAEDLYVKSGWNLISARTQIDVKNVFKDANKITSVWKWQNGKWAVYLPGQSDGGQAYANSKGFSLLTTISPGEGFWVNANADTLYTLSGTEVDETKIDLAEGWNLLGLKTNKALDVTTLNDVTSVWKWENNKWAVYLPGEEDGGKSYAESKGFALLTTIFPGEGFWVNTGSAGSIDNIETPPVVGKVTYPDQKSVSKVALYKAMGLASSDIQVEMPPVPGATVKAYLASDTNCTNPLAEVKTDDQGNYVFTAKDFKDGNVPSDPIVVKAEFKSPINPQIKVAVSNLVDPATDKGVVKEVNPLTEVITQKIKTFVEETFKVTLTKEIMNAAKTFIDLIAQQVESQGLTQFDDNDFKVAEIEDNGTEVVVEKNATAVKEMADKMIDKATTGLFDGMANTLIQKAEKGDLGAKVQVDDDKKLEFFQQFFASLGFLVGTKDEQGNAGIIAFMPTPMDIPENALPGQTMFGDRAFRFLVPDDLKKEAFNKINDPAFKYHFMENLERPFLSSKLVETLAEASINGTKTTLEQMASAIKSFFKWAKDDMKMVDGIPVELGMELKPATGESVLASELVSAFTGEIASSPQEVARDMLNRDYYIVELSDMAIQEKIDEIVRNNGTQDDVNNLINNIKSEEDLRALVSNSDIFGVRTDELAHKIFAALDPSLYGKPLTATTPLDVKTAFFLVQEMLNRIYLIYPEKGWFNEIKDAAGNVERIEPAFDNFKHLRPADNVNKNELVTKMINAIFGLNVTLDDATKAFADNFYAKLDELRKDAGDVFEMGDFKPDKTYETATVKGRIANTDLLTTKEVQLWHCNENGCWNEKNASLSDDGSFEFQDLKTNDQYELRFADLKEFNFPFYLDNFNDSFDLGDIWLPAEGDDASFMPVVPGISMWLDQKFFDPFNEASPLNDKDQGPKFANWDTNKPFIVAIGDPNGDPDLLWKSDTGLTGYNGAQIARLVWDKDDDGVQEKVYGIASLFGRTFNATKLKNNLDWQDSVKWPEEDNAVYVVRTGEGRYFFLEVRFFDKDENGNPTGLLDMGFAKLGNDLTLDVPQDMVATPGATSVEGLMVVTMCPADHYDLDENLWSPPEFVPFGYDKEIATQKADLQWMPGFTMPSIDEDKKLYAIDLDDIDGQLDNASDAIDDKQESDRILGVENGAQFLALIEINATAQTATLTPLNSTTVNATVGNAYLVATNQNKLKVIVVVNMFGDTITFVTLDREKVIKDDDLSEKLVNATKIVVDLQDGLDLNDEDNDGIPAVFDDNDFAPNTIEDFQPDDGSAPTEPDKCQVMVLPDGDITGLTAVYGAKIEIDLSNSKYPVPSDVADQIEPSLTSVFSGSNTVSYDSATKTLTFDLNSTESVSINNDQAIVKFDEPDDNSPEVDDGDDEDDFPVTITFYDENGAQIKQIQGKLDDTCDD